MFASEKDDFDLDSVFDEDEEFGNIFEDDATPEIAHEETPRETEDEFTFDEDFDSDLHEEPEVEKKDEVPLQKKRTFLDFEPDMDAILLTAQSSMIIEGIKYYSKKLFSAKTLNVYIESLKGVDLYIKILNRNSDNYHKLKKLIDQDIDCQEVEKTAFNIFEKVYSETPDSDRQKLEAFEMLQKLFTEAVNKASISKSMLTIKQYFLLSGGLDEGKIRSCVQTDNVEFKATINNLNQQVKIAIDLLKKGKGEIAQGLKGKDLNIFVIKSSELLIYYYDLIGNQQLLDYYKRINDLYKKYFVIRD